MRGMRRRDALRRLAALALAGAAVHPAQQAAAIGPRSRVGIGRMGPRGHRPDAVRRLLWEASQRTSMDAAKDASWVTFTAQDLFWQPLVVWSGEARPSALNARARARLRRYIGLGGLLWLDGPAESAFLPAARAEVARALDVPAYADGFPVLDQGHVLFKSFFLVNRAPGRTAADPAVRAVLHEQRIVALETRTDVLGALDRQRLGGWAHACTPGGERQRERAIRFALNTLMYATTLDYKADQVHLPFILKKRRRQP